MNMQSPLPFAVALGIGLLIGVGASGASGQWSPGRGHTQFRALASLLGAVSMHLGGPVLLGLARWDWPCCCCPGAGRGPGHGHAAALLLTLALGGLCLHDPALASGLAVAILLAARSRLHRFVRTVLSRNELVDALILAAGALVVLPCCQTRTWGRSTR